MDIDGLNDTDDIWDGEVLKEDTKVRIAVLEFDLWFIFENEQLGDLFIDHLRTW